MKKIAIVLALMLLLTGCGAKGPESRTLFAMDTVMDISVWGKEKTAAADALETLIREARFTVYPSEWYENCPFSVMESQMYGTPVLGADIGGIPELIEPGKTGLLFESGNAADLKQQIEKLWSDRPLLEEMSQNCTPDRFASLERYTEELMKYYA